MSVFTTVPKKGNAKECSNYRTIALISQPLPWFVAIHQRDFDSTLPLQYSCLENPTDRGAWQAAVHGVEKSWTRLSD